jgi:predicted O-methyltransferase YrrM
MNTCDLEFLAWQATTHTKILEMGSYYGRSTRALADNTSGFVIACDNFKGPEDIVITWKARQEIYDNFTKNLADHIATGKVLPWKADHDNLDFTQAPKPPKYDFIFVDGSHRYEFVVRDVKTALSVIESGGIICGHDYDMGSPGVVQGVTEVLGTFNLAENSRMWWKQCE